jgi:hypothetical protein
LARAVMEVFITFDLAFINPLLSPSQFSMPFPVIRYRYAGSSSLAHCCNLIIAPLGRLWFIMSPSSISWNKRPPRKFSVVRLNWLPSSLVCLVY